MKDKLQINNLESTNSYEHPVLPPEKIFDRHVFRCPIISNLRLDRDVWSEIGTSIPIKLLVDTRPLPVISGVLTSISIGLWL